MASFPKDPNSDYHRIVFQKRVPTGETDSTGNKITKLTQKPLYFRKDKFTEKEVYEIMLELEKQQAKNQFDPWRDKVEFQEEQPVLTLTDAISKYLAYRKQSVSSGTIDLEGRILKRLQTITGKYLEAEELTQRHLDIAINESGLTGTTARTHRAYLKSFIEYLFNHHNISVRFPDLRYPKSDFEKRREPVTIDQLPAILQAFDDHYESLDSPNSRSRKRRDYGKRLIRIGFYMGLRISEMIAAKPAWVIKDGTMFRVGDLDRWNLPDPFTPKSQREYDDPIAIPREVKPDIQACLAECDDRFGRLFFYSNRSSISSLLTYYMEQAFPGYGLSPHSLRHGCASYWLNERNVPVEQVQSLMRHRSIDTTMQYYHRDDDTHIDAFN